MDDRDSITHFESRAFAILFFDALTSLAFAMLCAIFLTALLSKRISRSPPWFSFIGSTVFWCFSYIIFFQWQFAPTVTKGLCAFQAATMYASNPLVSTAAVSLLIELLLTMKMGEAEYRKRVHAMWNIVLLVAPYCIFFFVVIWVLLICLANLDLIERDPTSRMFCHVKPSANIGLWQPHIISGVGTLFGVVLMLWLALWITFILLKHKRPARTSYKEKSESSTHSFSRYIRRFLLVVMLSIYGIIMSITSFATSSVYASIEPSWYISLAIMPLSVALIFGTQKDLLSVWFCCVN